MSVYIEKDESLGADIHWNNADIVYSLKTHKDTMLEFVSRPEWGISCYMNGTIQSCEFDEALYHTNLVRPIFDDKTKNAVTCIFGGGEGATAREVLKFSSILHIDMIEWDSDVVDTFKAHFPQWAHGAWNDKRLSIYFYDAFTHITTMTDELYTHVIVDLFEPEDQFMNEWNIFYTNVYRILSNHGKVSLYAGMYNYFLRGAEQNKLIEVLNRVGFKNIHVKKVYIPSFLGEACFITAEKVE
jgi:spermidine synthase